MQPMRQLRRNYYRDITPAAARDHRNYLPVSLEIYWASGQQEAGALVERMTAAGLAPTRCLVADLGCGNGRVARAMSPRVRGVLACELTLPVLAAAFRELEALPNVRFCLMDELPPAAAEFAYCLQVFQHCTAAETHELLERIAGVLVLGGLACLHFAALETKPHYPVTPYCRCFTREEAAELTAAHFEVLACELGTLHGAGAAQMMDGIDRDYFVMARKR